MRAFDAETSLVDTALKSDHFHLGLGFDDWNRWSDTEVPGLFGVPDVLFAFAKRNVRGDRLLRVLSFEMKLTNWRKALAQAFRYQAFSHYSYVVMDQFYVRRALLHLDRFERANIGLVGISVTGDLEWYHRPRYRRPYSDRLHRRLRNRLQPILFQDQQDWSVAPPEDRSYRSLSEAIGPPQECGQIEGY